MGHLGRAVISKIFLAAAPSSNARWGKLVEWAKEDNRRESFGKAYD